MEAIILMGCQATGKSFFYKEHFFNTHVRISLDLLNTRNKETAFMETCLALQQRFVVDNTNPSRQERQKYIRAAKARKYKIIGYYFESKIADSLRRNAGRTGKEKIPAGGVRNTFGKLEHPSYEEGFDQLYFVRLTEENTFDVLEWNNEI